MSTPRSLKTADEVSELLGELDVIIRDGVVNGRLDTAIKEIKDDYRRVQPMRENGTAEQEKGYHGQPLFFLGLIRRCADWKKQNDGNWPKFNELEKIHLEKWVKETRGRPVIAPAEETPAEKPKKIAPRPIQKEAPPAKPKSARPPALQGNAIAGPSKVNEVVYVRRTAPEVPSEGENDMDVDGPKSFQELDQGSDIEILDAAPRRRGP
ncbi:hypothetical protein CPB83DRAFT_944457 [Crepidotus variabilis]|uniref:Uncharacterized protein n=1 Tax=Crepidotus variabilis TaxID=179855 RepID=A0A9P6E9N4_9AGAR|nr:hypothetical protein CPB83DRAFT_944457 [Crepidotus variabilis]